MPATKVEIVKSPPTDNTEIVSAVGTVAEAVNNLPAALKVATPSQFDLFPAPQATHIKMRTSALVLSPTAAGAAIVNVGSRTWTFSFAAAGVIVLPFVQLVDRGVDCAVVLGVAGAPCLAYMIYTPE